MSLEPAMAGAITFVIGDRTLLTMLEDGRILREGREVATDADLVEGFRAWLKEAQRGEASRVAEARVHELKTWPEQYRRVRAGQKRHEIRKNDRRFLLGDRLVLKEWDPTTEQYTGHACLVDVTWITYGGAFGLTEDICVMSIVPRFVPVPEEPRTSDAGRADHALDAEGTAAVLAAMAHPPAAPEALRELMRDSKHRPNDAVPAPSLNAAFLAGYEEGRDVGGEADGPYDPPAALRRWRRDHGMPRTDPVPSVPLVSAESPWARAPEVWNAAVEACAKVVGKHGDELWADDEKKESTRVHASRMRVSALKVKP